MANNKIKEIIFCLDAGHYENYNQSPANRNYYEAKVMWILHLLMKKYLEEYKGVKVILTRDKQEIDLALRARGEKAAGCVVLLSYHSNAVGSGVNEAIDYVAVYHLVNDTTTECDDVSAELAAVLAPVIAEVMGTKQGYKILTRKSSNDRNDDGIMNDNYYGILNGARSVEVAALILEHSFHTNTRSTNWLLDESNLNELAKAEAAALASYYGLEKKETEPQEDVLYRVQVGAYKNVENAETMYEKVRAATFDAFMIQMDGLYKIQVGAYKVKGNADNQLAKIQAAGFEAFITTKSGKAVSAVSTQTVYYSKYTGNSGAIDEVFKAIGVPSQYIKDKSGENWKVRMPVAKAQGITDYKATAEQNSKMISLAKKGKLVRV